MEPHATVECYGAGELIQRTGTIPDAISFLISGHVLLVAEGEDGSRAEIGTLEQGSLLGTSTLIRNPAIATSYAVDEVTLLRVEREAIEEVVARDPVLLQKLDRSIDERRAEVVRALSGDDAEVSSSAG